MLSRIEAVSNQLQSGAPSLSHLLATLILVFNPGRMLHVSEVVGTLEGRNRVRVKKFDINAVLAIVGGRFHGIDPANTTTCTPLAQPELKVEMGVTAYRRRG